MARRCEKPTTMGPCAEPERHAGPCIPEMIEDPEPTDALVERLEVREDNEGWPILYLDGEVVADLPTTKGRKIKDILARLRSMGEPDGWEVECDTDWGPGWHYGGDTQEEAHERGRRMVAYTRRVRPYWKARFGEPVTVATPTDEPEEGEDE